MNLTDSAAAVAPPAPATASAGFSASMAAWARALDLEAIPNRARRIACLAVLDWFAVAAAGAREPAARILRDTIPGDRQTAEATVIGAASRSDTVTAALLNGASGHALDYDDVHNALPGHATAAVAPALLALAEAKSASGPRFLAAFVCGFEIACRMGVFASPGLFRRGYQGSTTAGAIGAAAACGHLLGLDEARMRKAFGLAATQASGLQATFGSMAKCFNIGKAAQSGLIAALLASRDFDCAEDVLEAPRGYGAVFADGGNPAAAMVPPPGGWHLYRNLFKHHASCFMTHAPIEALRVLQGEAAFGADDLERLVVRVEPHFHRVVLTPPPRTGLEAKFNLPFCLALALSGADTGAMATFDDETASRPDLHALAARCMVEPAPEIPFESAAVDVLLRNGRRAAATHDSGEPELDLDALEQRLRRKAAKLVSAEFACRLADAFVALQAHPNMAALMAELRG